MDMKRSFLRIVVVGVSAAALVGCVADGALDDQVTSRSDEGEVPDGAIWMAQGIYAVPVAVDDEGCEQFSQWTKSGATQPVVLYRDEKGGFSALKSDKASCNAEMISAGADNSGCPTFRAEQPDGKLTDVIYYRSESGFTVNYERAVCEGWVEG